MFSRYTNDGNEADIDFDDGFDDNSEEEEFKARSRGFHIGQRIGDEEIK